MNWCVYDIKSQLGVKDSQVFIHYDDLVLNQQTLETNNYSQQTIQKINKESRKFTEALDQLNDYTYQTIVKNNKSFCLVIFGDGILTSVLPKNAQKFQVKLPLHYHQYFDIATEFKKFIPHAIQLQTLADMLKYTNLNLKDDNTETLSQSECKSILRLINMLTRQGHVFNFPVKINSIFLFQNLDSMASPEAPGERERENACLASSSSGLAVSLAYAGRSSECPHALACSHASTRRHQGFFSSVFVATAGVFHKQLFFLGGGTCCVRGWPLPVPCSSPRCNRSCCRCHSSQPASLSSNSKPLLCPRCFFFTFL